MLGGQDHFVTKSVIMGLMDMIVLTTVVVTVGEIPRVTNRLVTVTGVAAQNTPIAIVAKFVHMDIMEWNVEAYVVDIV